MKPCHVHAITFFLLMFLCGFGFAQNKPLDFPTLAGEAWKANKPETALEFRYKAYEAQPNGDRLFWLCYTLKLMNRPAELVALFDKVPRAHWYPNGHDTEIHRIFASALFAKDRNAEVIPLIYDAIDKNDARQIQNYWWLVDRRHGVGREFAASPEFTKRFSRLYDYTKSLSSLEVGYADDLFSFCLIYMNVSVEALDYAAALQFLDCATMAAKHTKQPVYNTFHADFFRKAVLFRQSGVVNSTPLTMKYIGMYIQGIDADITQKDGNTIHKTERLSDAYVQRTIALNRQDAALAGFAFEYMSRGKIRFQFDFRQVDATVVGTQSIPDETLPHLGPLHVEAIKNFDGIMYFYHDAVRQGTFGGGSGFPHLIPYLFISNRTRPMAWLNQSADYTLYIHELFHGFETIYGITGHGFQESRQAEWTDSYRSVVEKLGTDMAMAYYESVMLEKMIPAGIEKLITRTNAPIDVPEEAYQRLLAAVPINDFDRLRKARQFYLDGNTKWYAKQYPEALVLYKKAVELEPYYVHAHQEIVNLYLKQLPNAAELQIELENHFKRFVGLRPTVDATMLEHLMTLYKDKGKTDDILSFYEQYTPLFKNQRILVDLDYYYDRALEQKYGPNAAPKVKIDENKRIIHASGTFNGSTDYLEIGARSYILGTAPFRIEADIQSNATGKKQYIVSQRSRQGFNGEYILYVNPDGKVEFFVYGDGKTAFTLQSKISIQDGKTHQIKAIRTQNGSGKLYVDDILVAEAPKATPVQLIPLQVYVGADRLDMQSYFSGTISRVEVYASE